MVAAPQVRVEERGNILIITLDRAQRRNAITQQVADEIEAALDLLEQTPPLRVGVLAGAPPCFSAGTDLASVSSPRTERGGEYGLARRARRKPLIAAVEGYALGGGMELLLACDLVVAANDSFFGLPEVSRGVVANCGALFRAPDRLPTNVAVELLLTGGRLDAVRAYGLGFVNRLCDPGKAVDSAIELGDLISLASPTAVAATLEALTGTIRRNEDEAWVRTKQADVKVAASHDRAEGIAAFFAKRPPQWARS